METHCAGRFVIPQMKWHCPPKLSPLLTLMWRWMSEWNSVLENNGKGILYFITEWMTASSFRKQIKCQLPFIAQLLDFLMMLFFLASTISCGWYWCPYVHFTDVKHKEVRNFAGIWMVLRTGVVKNVGLLQVCCLCWWHALPFRCPSWLAYAQCLGLANPSPNSLYWHKSIYFRAKKKDKFAAWSS
jgi:hypothetical protein